MPSREDDPLLRQAKWTTPWQWALGMLSKGRERGLPTPVQIVDDVSGADLRWRGSLIADRYVQPAFAGTHGFVQIVPGSAAEGYGFQLLAVSIVGPVGVQLSSFPGAGIANVVNVDPEVNGNVSQFLWRTGNLGSFPGPEFAGWTPPRERPYTITRGTCGQRGPVLIGPPRQHEVTPPPDARAYSITWFPEPIPFTRGSSPVFIANLPNQILDIGWLLEIPMLAVQQHEGF
jgi:hypothetical protein